MTTPSTPASMPSGSGRCLVNHCNMKRSTCMRCRAKYLETLIKTILNSWHIYMYCPKALKISK